MKIKSNLNRPFLPFLILKSLAMSATSVPSLLVGLVLALNPGTVQAASGNWNADTNGIWSDATKWSSNPTVPGTAPGDTVGLTFDITTNRTITIDTTSRTVGTLNIGDSGSPYYAYTLAASGGATLTFDNSGGGAALNKTGASTAIDTISAPLKLNDNLTVTLTTQPLTISGAISESGGARSLTKAGAGAMTLSGVNTYSGGTVIGGGNLTIGTTTGAGSGSITFSGGARLYVTDGLTIGNDITINNNTGGSGSGLIQNTGNGNATLTGTITINNNAAAGGHFSSVGTGSLTIAGAVNSSVPVSSRTGTVTFSGGGSYTNFLETGMVLIGADNGLSTNTVLYMAASGTATFDLKGHNQTLAGLTNNIANLATVTNSAGAGALTLNVSGANSYAYAGVIGGGANLRLVKNGTGTQTLSGTNTFSGGTTINSGTLVMGGSTALGAASGTLTVNTGGVLNMNGNSGTIGALSGTGGTITSSIAGAITLTDNQAGSTTFAGVMQDGSGTLSFVKTGAGSLTLNGANTYSGATTVNSGALLVNSPGSLGAGSVVTVTNGATLGGTAPSAARLLWPQVLLLRRVLPRAPSACFRWPIR